MEETKLTALSHYAGCGAKVPPGELAKALGCLNIPVSPNVLAGMADDAGVYKLTDDLAIVETIDMIGPIVDDPKTFGKVAACNCLSDIYAMGGTPITAMNVICFPADTQDIKIMGDILNGALEILVEAGVSLVGGHSVRSDEVRFGVSVTGTINPNKIVTKGGAQVGDDIVITKPLGVGLLSTALKAGEITETGYEKLIKNMTTLNKDAALAMVENDIKCATDITGFGLLGHLAEMLEPTDVSADIYSVKVPIIKEAIDCAKQGLIPEGMYTNWEYRNDMVKPGMASDEMMAVLYDPQTSGGLMMCCPHEKTSQLMESLKSHGVEGFIIGKIKEKTTEKPIIKII